MAARSVRAAGGYGCHRRGRHFRIEVGFGRRQVVWDGQGVTNGQLNKEECGIENATHVLGAFLFWKYTANDATSAMITIYNDGNVVEGPTAMSQAANGSFGYISEFYPFATVGASVTSSPDSGGSPQLTISHGCTGLKDSDTTTELHLGGPEGAGVDPVVIGLGDSVVNGSSVHDSATVSGDGITVPTGTVTFVFYQGTANTAEGACLTPIGDPFTAELQNNGDGTSTADMSAAVGPLTTAGAYGFIASYEGDDNYKPSQEDCEYFRVKDNPVGTVSIFKTADASYKQDCSWEVEKTVTDNSVVVLPGGEAAFEYEVTATKTCGEPYGFEVTGTITVNNGSTEDSYEIDLQESLDLDSLTCVMVADPIDAPDDEVPWTPPADLGPGGRLDCEYAATLDSATDGTNYATLVVDGDVLDGVDEGGIAEDGYDFGDPILTGECATVTDAFDGGEPVALSDEPICGTTIFEKYTRNITSDETCDAETFDNTATVTWTGPKGEESDDDSETVTIDKLCIKVTKSADGTYDRTCNWDISKSVNTLSQVVTAGEDATFDYTVVVDFLGCENSGYEVHGTIKVENTGSVGVTVDVSDALSDANGTCVISDEHKDIEIAVGGSAEFDYSCTFTGDAPDSAEGGTNTATAKASNGQVETTATGEDDYSFARDTYTNGCVVVSDDVDDEGSPADEELCEDDFAPAGGSKKYEYQHTWTATAESCEAEKFDNTATITGDDDVVIDEETVTVTLEKLCLTIGKTAHLRYTRTCTPDVDKSALEEKDGITLAEGQTGTIHWTVEATLDCSNNDDGKVTGTITVKNTGSVEAALDVEDSLPGVVLDCPEGSDIIDPGEKIECTYSAPHALADGTNTAKATLTVGEVSDSETATADFEFEQKYLGCYNVVDSGVTLFSLCDDEDGVDASGSESYEQTVGPFSAGCTEFNVDNTAIVTRKGVELDSDTASVAIHLPCIHGYTVGFWGNQNGEARIQSMLPGDAPVYITWKLVNIAINFATGQLILPNSSNFCGLAGTNTGVTLGCARTNLDSGVNVASVNNLAQQTLALTYNSIYRDPGFSTQTLGWMGCTTAGVAGLSAPGFNGGVALSATSTIANALAYANYVLGNVSLNGGTATITQTQVGAVNALLGQCLNLEANP